MLSWSGSQRGRTEGIGASPEVINIVDAPFTTSPAACEILLGENPRDGAVWQKMLRRTQYFGRASVTIAAMSAVDMALWDLKGKKFGARPHVARRQAPQPHPPTPAFFRARRSRDAEIGQIPSAATAVKSGWEPMGQSEALTSNSSAAPARGSGREHT